MSLRDFLEGNEPTSGKVRHSPRCSICTNEELAREVAEWVEMRHNGETHQSVNWIWQHYFQPEHGVMACNTLRHHIRAHLGVTDL